MVAELIAYALIAYGAAGIVFACAFVMRGAGMLDPAAAKSGPGFRVMILPGSAALWPVLLLRWMRAKRAVS